jgi:hypothetical protein
MYAWRLTGASGSFTYERVQFPTSGVALFWFAWKPHPSSPIWLPSSEIRLLAFYLMKNAAGLFFTISYMQFVMR